MAEAARWTILSLAISVLIGLIMATGVPGYIEQAYEVISDTIELVYPFIADPIRFVRAILNRFCPPVLVNAMLYYSFFKPFLVWGIDLLRFVVHWIFK